MDKCRVTGSILDPSGKALAKATVRFTMTARDQEGLSIIMPSPVFVSVSDDGDIEVDLWPNARSHAGTYYMVAVFIFGKEYRSWRIDVPDAETANLTDISELVPPPVVDDARRAAIESGEYMVEARGYRDEVKAFRDEVMPLAVPLQTVADNIDSVNTVAGIHADVSTVADKAGQVVTVAAIADDVSMVSANAGAVVLAAAKMAEIEAAPGAAVSAGNSATAAATSASQAASKAVAMSLIFGA